MTMRWRLTMLVGVAFTPFWAAAVVSAGPTTEPAAPPATQPNTAVNSNNARMAAPASAPHAVPAPQAANDNTTDDDEQPEQTVTVKSIQSVVHLSLKNHLLDMTSDLPKTGTSAVGVKIPGFPGKVVALVDENSRTHQPFVTVRYDPPVLPGTTTIYQMSSLMPGDVRLSVGSEDAHTELDVQFIQSPMSMLNGDPREKTVRLYITVTDKDRNVKTVHLVLMADNVYQLRRDNPQATEEYFLPLLATLGQESAAFTVDHRTAWQVLVNHWPIDAKTTAAVKAVLPKMDSDDYQTRETATDDLAKLGEAAAAVVMRMPRDHLSSEQNSRLDTFLAAYKPLSDAEAAKLGSDLPFLLDCLYTDDLPTRLAALDQLRHVTGKSIDVSPAAQTGPAWNATVRQLWKQFVPPLKVAPPTTDPATDLPTPGNE